ncbi:MAG: hypothetical protein LAN37_10560 [Acidobacteriia bacterium]|nr:hypothetical protein [Terriglobia bacterium]
MTIGLGVLCESGKCIVMAADTRGTFPDELRIAAHEQIGKQFDLPRRFGCNIAGDSGLCWGVNSELHQQMESLPEEFGPDHIRNAIREAQFYELTNLANYALKRHLGITVGEWKSETLPAWLREQGKKIINTTTLPMQIAVGGFCSNGAALWQADFANPPDIREWSAIGSGSPAAVDALCRSKTEVHITLQRAVFSVTLALRAARRHAKKMNPNNPDIGRPADYVVITPKYFRRLPAQHPDLLKMMRKYSNKTLDDLDRDDDARLALLRAMYFPGTTQMEYALGLRRPVFDKFVWRGKGIHCDGETLRILSGTSLNVAASLQNLQPGALELEPN